MRLPHTKSDAMNAMPLMRLRCRRPSSRMPPSFSVLQRNVLQMAQYPGWGPFTWFRWCTACCCCASVVSRSASICWTKGAVLISKTLPMLQCYIQLLLSWAKATNLVHYLGIREDLPWSFFVFNVQVTKRQLQLIWAYWNPNSTGQRLTVIYSLHD